VKQKGQGMSEIKTKPGDNDPRAFIDSVENARRREDAYTILAMMQDITGEEPVLWGDSIIGFGNWRYRYVSGREGDWFRVGFSPRKANLTLYVLPYFTSPEDPGEYATLLGRLGKHKTGKSCLYINKLADVDMGALRELIARSDAAMRAAIDDAGMIDFSEG
jgi:hypothetical protein